jgi:hypothetical protein
MQARGRSPAQRHSLPRSVGFALRCWRSHGPSRMRTCLSPFRRAHSKNSHGAILCTAAQSPTSVRSCAAIRHRPSRRAQTQSSSGRHYAVHMRSHGPLPLASALLQRRCTSFGQPLCRCGTGSAALVSNAQRCGSGRVCMSDCRLGRHTRGSTAAGALPTVCCMGCCHMRPLARLHDRPRFLCESVLNKCFPPHVSHQVSPPPRPSIGPSLPIPIPVPVPIPSPSPPLQCTCILLHVPKLLQPFTAVGHGDLTVCHYSVPRATALWPWSDSFREAWPNALAHSVH